jgi:hypothetical protein
MKTIYFTLLLLIINLLPANAQPEKCFIRKSYPVMHGSTVRITNKYGNIIILTAKTDSVNLCATVAIAGPDNESIKKSLSLIEIKNFIKGDTITFATNYDKKFFSETLRQGRKSFTVNYTVKVPEYVNLVLSNEFGDIQTDELSGQLTARISQGTLSAKKLSKGNTGTQNSIYADHAKLYIDNINWLNLTLFNCQTTEIGKAQAISLKSFSSKISINAINSLVADSKSDTYEIGSITNLISDGIYSTFNIALINGKIKTGTQFGNLSIGSFGKGFTSGILVTNNSRTVIKTLPQIAFKTDIVATDTKIDFNPADHPSIKMVHNGKTISLSGDSNGIPTSASLNIRATGGSLVIK